MPEFVTEGAVAQVKRTIWGADKTITASLPVEQQASAIAWMAHAWAAATANPTLVEACATNPESLMSAILEAASRGLQPGTDEFYLTPRRIGGRWSILPVIGYQGYVKLMYNSGFVAKITFEVVRENDEFDYRPGASKVHHKIDWKLSAAQRGKIVLAYAIAKLTTGESVITIINQDRIDRAKASSAAAEKGPWATDEEAMWRKTAIRDLHKLVPTSARDMRVQQPNRDMQQPNRDNGPVLYTGPIVSGTAPLQNVTPEEEPES
jgi:recombination protein RecT